MAPATTPSVSRQVRWRWRAYQRECLEVLAGRATPVLSAGAPAVPEGGWLRSWLLLWRRQGGKSTTLAEMALYEMMRSPRRLVTYASASLLLGRELINKEAAVLYAALPQFRSELARVQVRLDVADGKSGRAVPPKVAEVDFASLFEAQRLEFRLWHDRGSCARTRIIAPNPATARGWTGTVLLDEFGFIRHLQELWEAIEPIVSTDRDFRFIGATTPPSDDAHFSYTLTEPPPGTDFPVKPTGNWYRSTSGQWVHRVDIFDASAAGLQVYDLQSGRELTPQEHRARALDADAWKRNYGILHVRGGTAAASLPALESAQARGRDNSRCFQVETPDDWEAVLAWTRESLGHGEVGLGWDLATTEGERSNPSAIAVVEQRSGEWLVRTVAVWKTPDPTLARARGRQLVEAVARRGIRPRRLCVDASNERYFAADVQRDFSPLLPVELIHGNATLHPPGMEPMPMKTYLGHRLIQRLEENQLTLPPESYLRSDFRRIRRDRGSFVTETGPGGEHGDTFDATKMALFALESVGGAGITATAGIRVGTAQFSPSRWNRSRG